jgi:hypothetical protein
MIDKIIAYENGDLDETETIELFQGLIDSGTAWSLQGSYGRTAMALIEAGYCTPPLAEVERVGLEAHDGETTIDDKVGTYCECGASYDPERRGYRCAR